MRLINQIRALIRHAIIVYDTLLMASLVMIIGKHELSLIERISRAILLQSLVEVIQDY